MWESVIGQFGFQRRMWMEFEVVSGENAVCCNFGFNDIECL